MMDHGNGAGWWWLMGVIMLAVVIAIGVLIAWLVTRTVQHPAGGAPPSDASYGARKILAERLARGEIDPAEYQERLSHLT